MTLTTPKSLRRASHTGASTRQAGTARLGGGCLLLASLAFASLVQAQQAPAQTPSKPASDSLTWNGITLYGIVDLGIQYNTHSAPYSDYFPAGSGSLVQKNGYDSPIGMTPSNLSQSRIGLSGNEPIGGDWAAVFRLETFFNPQSGNISDALKSVALNNGKPLTQQNVGVDSSVAGQLFAGAAYVGFASPTYGSLTFGRNVTLVADGISKYDPMGAAQAFSVIGFSGTAAGGGDTEDRRLDQSVKYFAKYNWLHVGALYQFSGSSGSQGTGYQFQLGGEFGGFSADAWYFKKYDAVSVGSLSVAQTQEVINNCTADATAKPAPESGIRCYSIGNSLAGTVSDNQTYMVAASYNFGDMAPIRLYAGYEHIAFDNPNNPLGVGTVVIGGYTLAAVNVQSGAKSTYFNQKTLEVFWAGFKWSWTPDLDFTAAFYGYNQNSFSAKNPGCGSEALKLNDAACSGTEAAVSVLLDYRLTKRFDLYGGSMWSGVKDGLAVGYYNRENIATTLGARFKF